VAATADLGRAVERARLLARPHFAGAIEVALPASVQVVGDETALVRVLLNLIVNAGEARAGRPGGRVDVRVVRMGATVVCDVTDNGPGLALEALRRLFQRPTPPSPSGRGNGLVLSRALMRRMAGDLELFATGRHGSTFRLRLMLAAPTHA
jgi:C4-dicarboxylate-specific signal transduction histidine kinase